METTWSKNKYTLISMFIYLLDVLILGDISGIKSLILLLFLITIPLQFNWRIKYTIPLQFNWRIKYTEGAQLITTEKGLKSFLSVILAGLVFGIYITPFGFSASKGDTYNNISYWVLLLQFNTFYALHRGSYKSRVDRYNLSDERDLKLELVLHPVKKRFFQ